MLFYIIFSLIDVSINAWLKNSNGWRVWRLLSVQLAYGCTNSSSRWKRLIKTFPQKRHRRLNAYHSSNTHTRRHSLSISSFWLHLYAQFTISMLFPLAPKVSLTPERKSDGMVVFWSGTCWKLTHLGTLPRTSQLDNGNVILTFPLIESLR